MLVRNFPFVRIRTLQVWLFLFASKGARIHCSRAALSGQLKSVLVVCFVSDLLRPCSIWLVSCFNFCNLSNTATAKCCSVTSDFPAYLPVWKEWHLLCCYRKTLFLLMFGLIYWRQRRRKTTAFAWCFFTRVMISICLVSLALTLVLLSSPLVSGLLLINNDVRRQFLFFK